MKINKRLIVLIFVALLVLSGCSSKESSTTENTSSGNSGEVISNEQNIVVEKKDKDKENKGLEYFEIPVDYLKYSDANEKWDIDYGISIDDIYLSMLEDDEDFKSYANGRENKTLIYKLPEEIDGQPVVAVNWLPGYKALFILPDSTQFNNCNHAIYFGDSLLYNNGDLIVKDIHIIESLNGNIYCEQKEILIGEIEVPSTLNLHCVESIDDIDFSNIINDKILCNIETRPFDKITFESGKISVYDLNTSAYELCIEDDVIITTLDSSPQELNITNLKNVSIGDNLLLCPEVEYRGPGSLHQRNEFLLEYDTENPTVTIGEGLDADIEFKCDSAFKEIRTASGFGFIDFNNTLNKDTKVINTSGHELQWESFDNPKTYLETGKLDLGSYYIEVVAE